MDFLSPREHNSRFPLLPVNQESQKFSACLQRISQMITELEGKNVYSSLNEVSLAVGLSNSRLNEYLNHSVQFSKRIPIAAAAAPSPQCKITEDHHRIFTEVVMIHKGYRIGNHISMHTKKCFIIKVYEGILQRLQTSQKQGKGFKACVLEICLPFVSEILIAAKDDKLSDAFSSKTLLALLPVWCGRNDGSTFTGFLQQPQR